MSFYAWHGFMQSMVPCIVWSYSWYGLVHGMIHAWYGSMQGNAHLVNVNLSDIVNYI